MASMQKSEAVLPMPVDRTAVSFQKLLLYRTNVSMMSAFLFPGGSEEMK